MEDMEALAAEARRRDEYAAQRDAELGREPISRLIQDARKSFMQQCDAGRQQHLITDAVLIAAFNNAISGLATEVQLEREYVEALEDNMLEILAMIPHLMDKRDSSGIQNKEPFAKLARILNYNQNSSD